MIYFVCTLGLAACLNVSRDICDNMLLSDKYRGQKWSFSSINRANKAGTKFYIFCEKDGEVTYLEE